MISKKILEKTKFPFYFFFSHKKMESLFFTRLFIISFFSSLSFYSNDLVRSSFSRLSCFLLTNNTDPNGITVSEFRCYVDSLQ